MRVGSLFSGIGGLDLGLELAGHEVVFQCEADARRRSILARHWQGVPIYEDVREVAKGARSRRLRAVGGEGDGQYRVATGRHGTDDIGLLVGGVPCQDFSVAGKRAGLEGDRSGLFWEFHRIARALRPEWILIENVPGLLSSGGGQDFGRILGALADLRYGMAWRILDSCRFGVPQRRRRLFLLGRRKARGHTRPAAECAAEVLSVGTRCDRHPPAGRKARKEATARTRAGVASSRRIAGAVTAKAAKGTGGPAGDECQNLVATYAPETAATLSRGSNPNSNAAGRRNEDDQNLVATYYVEDCEYGTLKANGATGPPRTDRHPLVVERAYTVTPESGQGGEIAAREVERSSVLSATDARLHDRGTRIAGPEGVRRLTPLECERLQGLPDDWTAGVPDTVRYGAIGDAVTVQVSRWIGERLADVSGS